MCEEIYGKIVVLLIIAPLAMTTVMAVWYGIEYIADKWAKSIEKDIAREKIEKPIIPTEEQIMKIKATTQKMYIQVSKKHILRVILEWEKIRGE